MAYIVNGQLVQDSSLSMKGFFRNISLVRLMLVLVPTLTLVASNPANDVLGILNLRNDDDESFGTKTFSFGKEKFVFGRRITNYFIFSLEENFDSVVFHAVQQTWTCPFNDFAIGEVCDSLAANFCSRKPLIFDENDLLHTTHRILCSLLILFAVLFFISIDDPRHFIHPKLDSTLSIFYQPRLLHNLVSMNLIVHPALSEMKKIIPKLHRRSIFSTGNYKFDFILGVLLLIVVIGNGANILASKIVKRHNVGGFSTVCAASLTYYQRILGRSALWNLLGIQVHASLIYWTNAAFLFWSPSRLVAWIAAGWAGNLLATYHLENTILYRAFSNFFGF